MNFILKKDVFVKINEHINFSSFYIQDIGINNFKYIKGIKATLMQNKYTMHYILSGKGYLNIGGREYLISKNSLFFIPPDTPYRYYPCDSEPWKYLWFSFNGNHIEIDAVLDGIGISADSPVIVPKNSKEILHALYSLDLSEYMENLVFSLTATSVFLKIILLIKTEHGERNSANICLITEKAASYLAENYAKSNLSISEVANELRLSHPYICRTFLKNKGITMKAFLTEYRLKKACELLSFIQLTIKDIAYETGFSDEMQFSKTFKKHFGMPPGTYRKKTQNN